MKNIFLLFLFSFISTFTFGQFRMVGAIDGSGWTTVNDSTYTGNVNFFTDLTGKGYLATSIDSAYQLFTGTEQIYFIDSTWNKTFSSASVRIIERNNTNGQPVGQVQIYTPNPSGTIPQTPFGSTGAVSQIQAAIDSWNARIMPELTSLGRIDSIDIIDSIVIAFDVNGVELMRDTVHGFGQGSGGTGDDVSTFTAKVNDLIATDKFILPDSTKTFQGLVDQMRDSTITYVNVDWYGATPNDNSDDDFPAIATAIASGHDVIFSPNATYRVDTTVTTGWDVQPGQTIDQQGATIYTTGIKSSLCNLYVLEAVDTNVTLRNIRFHGDRNFPDYTGTSADSTSNYRLIVAQDGGTGLKVENLYAYGGGGSTFKLRQQRNATLQNLNFYECLQSVEIFRSKHINVDGFYSLRDSIIDSGQYHHTYVDESSFINWSNSHMIGGSGKSFHIKDAGGNPEIGENVNITNVTLDSTGSIYLGDVDGISFSNITAKNCTSVFGGEAGLENLSVSGITINPANKTYTRIFDGNGTWKNISLSNVNSTGRIEINTVYLHDLKITNSTFRNPNGGADNSVVNFANNGDQGDVKFDNVSFVFDSLDANITRIFNQRDGDGYSVTFDRCDFIDNDVTNSFSQVATGSPTTTYYNYRDCRTNFPKLFEATNNGNTTLTNITTPEGDGVSPFYRISSTTVNQSSDFQYFEYTGAGGDSLIIDSFQIAKAGNEFQIITSASLKVKPGTGLINGASSETIAVSTKYVSDGTNLRKVTAENDGANLFQSTGTAATSSNAHDLGLTVQSWTRNSGTQFITLDGSTGKMSIGGTGTVTTEKFDVNGRMRVKSETSNAQGYIYFGAGSDYMREASGRWYFTDQGGVEDFIMDLNGSSAGIFRNLEGDFYLDANQSGKSLFLTTQTATRLGIASTGAITFNNYTSSSAFPGTTSHFVTQNSSGQFITKDAATFRSEVGAGDLLNNGNSGAVAVGSNDNTTEIESNGTTAITINTSQETGIGGSPVTGFDLTIENALRLTGYAIFRGSGSTLTTSGSRLQFFNTSSSDTYDFLLDNVGVFSLYNTLGNRLQEWTATGANLNGVNDAAFNNIMNYYHNSATPADDDYQYISWYANDSGSNKTEFARDRTVELNAADGSEDGSREFYYADAGTLKRGLQINPNAITLGNTTQGSIISIMNNTQRDALTPATGMTVYSSDDKINYKYDGARWVGEAQSSVSWDANVAALAGATDTILVEKLGNWSRVDSVVTFSYRFKVGWDFASPIVSFTLDLPIASNFTDADGDVEATVTMTQSDTYTTGLAVTGQRRVIANTTDDKIQIVAEALHNADPGGTAQRYWVTVDGSYKVK